MISVLKGAVFASLVCLLAAEAVAADRVALVIGNGAYRNQPALPNPPRDAADVSDSLKRLGFAVQTVIDGDATAIRRAMLEFGRNAQGSEMAVVFYAGHGIEVGGENWLLPVDAELRNDTDTEYEAVSLKAVTQQVGKARQLGLVILDACRNNPFLAKMQRSIRTRAVTRGLASMEPTDNVLVAYAAKDGTTASDGDGRNSPFTTALLNNLEKPGLEINFLFRNVRDEVMDATKREQQPFVYGSLSKDAIFLKRPDGSAPAPAPAPAVPQVAALAPQRAVNAFDGTWATTQDCPDAGKAKGYIFNYKVTVKDGTLEGKFAGSGGGTINLQGKINPDGTAYLSAEGTSGSPAFTINNQKAGSRVAFFIDAKFSGTRGSGSRTAVRKCDFTFVKLN